jgi:protein SCO1
MKIILRRTFTVALLTLALPLWAAPAKDTPLPANSVYQLSLPLTDHQGRATKLEDWRGKPVMITMFYTGCQFVCPRIVEALKHTEDGLSTKLPVLMVSLDPARDDVATLKAMADERGLDPKLWTLARTDARNVRKLAAMLGIQYRELASGEFNHSTVIILLDTEGRIKGKTPTLGDADPAFVALAKKVR